MERKLPDSLVSPDDLQLLALEVGGVAEEMASQAVRKSGTAAALNLSPQLLSYLGLKPGDTLPTSNELEKLKHDIEDLRKTAPVATLTLAAIPAQKLRQELVVWFREQIHPQTLMVFVLNREIGGGLAVRLGSQIFDWTFRQRLLNSRQVMSQVMKNV